jgi:predicted transcriptional regulator
MATGSSARRRAGQLEAEVIAALWASAVPLTPSEVHSVLDGGLAYNTVHTILGRLVDKGQIVRTVHDGRKAYAAVKDAAEDAADRMRAVLDSGVDRDEVLTRFVTALDPDEAEAVRAALRRLRRR